MVIVVVMLNKELSAKDKVVGIVVVTNVLFFLGKIAVKVLMETVLLVCWKWWR